MYNPRHFEEGRLKVVHEVIRGNPFGTLVTNGESGLVATHLPFLLDSSRGEFGVLRGHMARANRQWQDFGSGEALAIFQGPHAYISPSWYETGESVPTWNYVAVHGYGVARIVEDPVEAFALLRELTATFEAPYDQPWTTDGLSDKFVTSMVQAIVAFEIPIARIEGKAKMSQNRPQDQINVAAVLEAAGGAAVAAEIRARIVG